MASPSSSTSHNPTSPAPQSTADAAPAPSISTTSSISASASTSTAPTPALPGQPGVDFKVYRPPTNLNAPPPPTVTDADFTPTAADIRAAQATLSARRSALVDAPLQLRAAREAGEKAKRERWPETRIRVKFPDQTQLERTFPTTDKIRSVYAFVRGCLTEEGKAYKFILYQTPPKRDLKVSDPKVRDQTLYDLHLTPSSILLLRFENEDWNHDKSPAPLLPFILEQADDFPLPPGSTDSTSVPPVPAAASTLTKPTTSTPKAPLSKEEKEKKLAKFMKFGRK